MKTYKSHPIQLSARRAASLVGIMIWSAHYHTGQWSQEYRMGCRARKLLERSNEIGSFLTTRWFDALENYVDGRQKTAPAAYTGIFSTTAKETYQRLAYKSDSRNRK